MVTDNAEAQKTQNTDNENLYTSRLEDAVSDFGKYFEFELKTTYIEG